MSGLGFDAGTYNLVFCSRDKSNNIVHKREVNAFLEIPLDKGSFIFNMMKNSGVPLIEREKVAYALGEAAVEMAYSMPDLELKRPMRDGCVNPKEKDAFEIMSIMIHSMLDNVSHDKEPLYYSVPANALNEETDADYHSKILGAIFNAYQSPEGYKVSAFPVNEGLALIYAELQSKSYTGIGISCGSGMVNLCFAIFGVPVFAFSIVNSGDWIDKMAAKATGDSPTFINKEKTKINLLNENPTSLVERAIITQYKIMIEKTVLSIKKGIIDSGKKARTAAPIDVIIAGGTSIPNGFDVLFKAVIAKADMPIQIGNVIRPPDPLYSVSRGCLICAENSTK